MSLFEVKTYQQESLAAGGQEHWYAAYTKAHHERRVSKQLLVLGFQHFLPLYQTVRQWKDRRVILEMPLFPGYVFVRIALQDRLRIIQLPGVANLVGFHGTPVALPEAEIESLRETLRGSVRALPHPYLTAG